MVDLVNLPRLEHSIDLALAITHILWHELFKRDQFTINIQL